MYLPTDDDKAGYLVWAVRSNGNRRWLTKEDCPSRVHEDQHSAEQEAYRLSVKHNQTFVVVRTIVSFTPVNIYKRNLE